MSVAGLIHLMKMAKKGANFGKLSPQHLEIGNISDAEIKAAQPDIAAFLSTYTPAKSAARRREKTELSRQPLCGTIPLAIRKLHEK